MPKPGRSGRPAPGAFQSVDEGWPTGYVPPARQKNGTPAEQLRQMNHGHYQSDTRSRFKVGASAVETQEPKTCPRPRSRHGVPAITLSPQTLTVVENMVAGPRARAPQVIKWKAETEQIELYEGMSGRSDYGGARTVGRRKTKRQKSSASSTFAARVPDHGRATRC